MQILADENVPEEYVSALRGDGHDVIYSRDVDQLGPEATDEAITEYAEGEGFAILSTDVKDFADRDATVPVFVSPQDMSGVTFGLRLPVSSPCPSILRRPNPSGSLLSSRVARSLLLAFPLGSTFRRFRPHEGVWSNI